ncbi:hypothetical protein ACETK8_15325 [Brevundimonas staleyi]|uniref:CBS domain-containing protein n=1 Tax=Brevundimonas staleyi TaxID=74326 RepID=A0ABW0FYF0_9CAUL
MTYFCFIESSILSVPHMEPLAASTHDEAVNEALALMRLHGSAIAVHVFLGDEKVASALADGVPAVDVADVSHAAA